MVEKAASFSFDRQRWRQRYSSRTSRFSPLARASFSRVAARRIAREHGSCFEAVLQIGGWHRLAPARLPAGVLRCSYHDAILATYVQRPGLKLDPRSRGVRRAWDSERRTFDQLDLIFTMSDWVRDALVRELRQDPGKVVTVRAGANLPLPEEPGPRPDRPVRFLFVGKGDFTRKGGPSVLAAFGIVRKQFPDAELLIVGPERALVEAPGVTWLGRIRHSPADARHPMDRVYRMVDAYVMPSVYEPFGIAFLEAMAYGLPCVGANACAMPELIEDGVTGFLAEPSDTAGLADRLLRLAGDVATARTMGLAGRRRYLERYTWERVAATIAGTVERTLRARGAAGAGSRNAL